MLGVCVQEEQHTYISTTFLFLKAWNGSRRRVSPSPCGQPCASSPTTRSLGRGRRGNVHSLDDALRTRSRKILGSVSGAVSGCRCFCFNLDPDPKATHGVYEGPTRESCELEADAPKGVWVRQARCSLFATNPVKGSFHPGSYTQ